MNNDSIKYLIQVEICKWVQPSMLDILEVQDAVNETVNNIVKIIRKSEPSE